MRITTYLKRASAVSLACLLLACASSTKPGAVGVTRQQFLMVPATTVEKMALVSYAQQNQKARQEGKLITSGAEYERLDQIAKRLRQQVDIFREDTRSWQWQLTLIDAPTINATCAPGGKITFYTGIIRKLALTDDEIAVVMGHEIAHALREHGRERISQAYAQNIITGVALAATDNSQNQIALANQFAHYLYTLPNSRQNESEADAVGLELAARAGYNPSAAVNLWKKMAAESGDKSPPQFLSTHPAHETRIDDINALLPKVMPLYQTAPKPEPLNTMNEANGQTQPAQPAQTVPAKRKKT
ncbi:peptidase M48-like protein [Paucimonas lemoignei]|uniref:Peptidase M48-like protein n=1 Tax=Paucimonas lemoignei TaxID=29443 RepID=A0A4V2UIL0_PAULE|nr:M48 family metallopeptidase [Paucimonas lemoignei]TCS36580.1 peptidase M48-like protein [Paucimonas lemoignei]